MTYKKKEAAYRKILVIAEDDETIRPKTIEELFDGVRDIHFKSYLRYLYFNVGRIAYLQANVLSAYVFLAPAIVAGVVTLGVMQQIIRAFGRVEGSMQYLLKAWPTIIELLSVYKRLREFESQIKANRPGKLQLKKLKDIFYKIKIKKKNLRARNKIKAVLCNFRHKTAFIFNNECGTAFSCRDRFYQLILMMLHSLPIR